MGERLERRNSSSSSGLPCSSGSILSGPGDLDNKVHEELEEKNKELMELRHAHNKLKREVAAAQDELDAATNNVRKLQRTNDEIQEQMESLQMQVTHLQARLRSSSGSFMLHREALLHDTLSEDDGNEY